MNIKAIRSDKIYTKMMSVTNEEKESIYRYELMKPFEFKWQCIGIPLQAEEMGGYDVVSAAGMGGDYTPSQITNERLGEIEQISDNAFWNDCENSIHNTLEGFEVHGITLPTQDYVFTVILNNPKNPMSAMTDDYCGDGGIPGYIIGTIIPNEKSLKMLPVALAHEANHNVRWQFVQWNPNITLADMIVSEGLAENFSAAMFGEDKIGKWVTETSPEMLETVIKPRIKENLMESDFNKLSSFLYGDEIMAMRGGASVGMPYCGGYACGYALVAHYLKKTGKSIYEATITSTTDILKETEDFWN
ncbi:DUF2268 domain-containing protein [Eubacterium barkeri]|uniref:Uncharacterized protein YjaZ n=1 Tax=Eubacterium barkeri TaxID=1528 RepID=A0A1H3FSQ6_EUBBA|nr:DUF2268 domain-containing protein [Eubacterium barkeri]SDX93408.1 Uncharacterized protein YjaZ [Eubacterium barkeri]